MRRELGAARRFADEHGAERAYDSEQALLADPQVNAVYVATPPHLHARQDHPGGAGGQALSCAKSRWR